MMTTSYTECPACGFLNVLSEKQRELRPRHRIVLGEISLGVRMTRKRACELRTHARRHLRPKAEKGICLGLSHVDRFVKESGGHVKAHSEPGHGTRDDGLR
jgi:signal transduction histidine kinase